MASERKFSPQVEEIRPFYSEIKDLARPLLTGKKEGKREDVLQIFDLFKKAPDVLISSLRNLPEDQERVKNAFLEGKISDAEQMLKTLYSAVFKEGDKQNIQSDYYTILKTAFEVFIEKYGAMLPEDTPKTFEELMVQVVREKSKETLSPGEQAIVLPDESNGPKELSNKKEEGTKEREEPPKPPVSGLDGQNNELENWKAGWFDGKISLVRRELKSEIEKLIAEEEHAGGQKNEEMIRRYNYIKSEINKIQDLDELREVAVVWLSVMFGSGEVQKESFRTEVLDYLEIQAHQLADISNREVDKEKAIFAGELLTAARSLYVYWWEGWLGSQPGTGSSASMISIALEAGKFDRSNAYAVLMQQQAIALAQHTQDIKQGKRLFDEIHKLKEKNVVWEMMGYMLRRSTGMAIYDGIEEISVDSYKKIRDLVERIKPLEDVSDEAHREENEAQIRALDLQISEVLSEMIGGLRPDSTDYVLFLNHFVPWYINVRYRHKFKDRLDLMLSFNKNAVNFVNDYFKDHNQGFIDKETVERIMTQFQYLNIADCGAYSEHKRPDTYSAWEQNLRIISAVASDPRVRLSEPEFRQEIERLKKEGKAKNKEIEVLERARRVYKTYEKDPSSLEEMLSAGLNFAMKMISLYEPGRDKRSFLGNGKKKHSLTDWENAFKMSATDWEADNLLNLTTAKKAEILRKFMDNSIVAPQDKEEIVKNNLIRVVPINSRVLQEIQKLDAEEQGQMATFFETHIYDEFISMDDLFAKKAGKKGDTWMRFFDQSKFSANAFVMYEHYAESDRKLTHEVFAEQTSPSKLLELSEGFKASDKCKHLIDTARLIYDGHRKEAYYDHATAWRLERVHKAIEAYVSQLYIMSIAMYRKKGLREPVAENIVQLVGRGINESWFDEYHFEPVMSEREKNEGLSFAYSKIESHRQMGNDYKLRYLLNLLGMEGDDQRILWEYGFLANINGRTPYIPETDKKRFDKKHPDKIDFQYADNPDMVDYDTILLMAGVEERGVYKKGEVNGYKIDEDLASLWFDYYKETRRRGVDRTPKMADFSPEKQKMLLDRAKKFRRFQGKSEEFIRNSLDRQFTILHDKFNNEVYGYFSQIFSYERNLTFIWDKVLGAYVKNTFDKDKRYAVSVETQRKEMGWFRFWFNTTFLGYDPSKWPNKRWNPRINYMRREAFLSELIQKRKFAFEDGPGFNKYLVSQVITTDKNGKKIPPKIINSYDHENYDKFGNSLYLHGVDVIESWLVGSGPIGFGTDWRLTRLPIGYDALALLALIEAFYSEEAAVEKFIYSKEANWETGSMKSVEDRRVLIGNWAKTMTPELREMIYDMIEDPGGTGVIGQVDKTTLKEINGCTPEQVEEFRQERAARDVADLELGADKAINLEAEKQGEFLSKASSVFLELPNAFDGEIGALLNFKDSLKEVNKTSRNRVMFFSNIAVSGAAIALAVSVLPAASWVAPVAAGLIGGIAYGVSTVRTMFNKNDLPPNDRKPFIFDITIPKTKITIGIPDPYKWRIPFLWKWSAKNSPRLFGLPLFALPIFCGTLLTSKRNLREQGRDADVLIEGKEPIYDTIISKEIAKFAVDMLRFYKEKLDVSSANIEKRAHAH